jgi:hypothetical protein
MNIGKKAKHQLAPLSSLGVHLVFVVIICGSDSAK